MTDIGKLDRRIVLQSPAASTESDGGVTTAWTTVATVWAGFRPARTREIEAARQASAEAEVVFTIRYRDDVTAAWRVTLDGRPFDVTGVTELGRRQWLEIAATSRSAADA